MKGVAADYLELTKPKVVALIVFTAVVGMFLAVPALVPLDVLVFGTLGIGLAAASAAALNHLVDRHIDDHRAFLHLHNQLLGNKVRSACARNQHRPDQEKGLGLRLPRRSPRTRRSQVAQEAVRNPGSARCCARSAARRPSVKKSPGAGAPSCCRGGNLNRRRCGDR
jgi:hypothetical protein